LRFSPSFLSPIFLYEIAKKSTINEHTHPPTQQTNNHEKIDKKNLPVFGVGLCMSSITFSKNRFLSDTVFGVFADAGGVGD
jgi:hypothetical protein